MRAGANLNEHRSLSVPQAVLLNLHTRLPDHAGEVRAAGSAREALASEARGEEYGSLAVSVQGLTADEELQQKQMMLAACSDGQVPQLVRV